MYLKLINMYIVYIKKFPYLSLSLMQTDVRIEPHTHECDDEVQCGVRPRGVPALGDTALFRETHCSGQDVWKEE